MPRDPFPQPAVFLPGLTVAEHTRLRMFLGAVNDLGVPDDEVFTGLWRKVYTATPQEHQCIASCDHAPRVVLESVPTGGGGSSP